MKPRRTIYTMHKAAKKEIAELKDKLRAEGRAIDNLIEERDAERAAHQETRARMNRYDQDAREARTRAHRLEDDLRRIHDELVQRTHEATQAKTRDQAIRDFLDGIEGAIGIERMIESGEAQRPAPPAGTYVAEPPRFYHSPSNNGSTEARLACVMARILRDRR